MDKKKLSFNTQFTNNIFKQLMWDYNYSPEEIQDLFENKINDVGHYTRETLFKKLIENFPWSIIIKIFPSEMVLALLTDDLIKQLRFKSLQRDYKYAKKRLQEIVSTSG